MIKNIFIYCIVFFILFAKLRGQDDLNDGLVDQDSMMSDDLGSSNDMSEPIGDDVSGAEPEIDDIGSGDDLNQDDDQAIGTDDVNAEEEPVDSDVEEPADNDVEEPVDDAEEPIDNNAEETVDDAALIEAECGCCPEESCDCCNSETIPPIGPNDTLITQEQLDEHLPIVPEDAVEEPKCEDMCMKQTPPCGCGEPVDESIAPMNTNATLLESGVEVGRSAPNSLWTSSGYKIQKGTILPSYIWSGSFSHEWTITFDFKPLGRVGGWGGIFHHGSAGTHRSPALWLYPNSGRLHFRLSTTTSWNSGTDPGQQVRWGQWNSIKLVHTLRTIKIYLNGQLVINGGYPTNVNEWGRDSLWISSPWDSPANGYVRYFSYAHDGEQRAPISQIKSRRGLVVAGMKQSWPTNYRLTFKMYVAGAVSGWTSIMKRGTPDNYARSPAFFMNPGSKNAMHVCISSTGNRNNHWNVAVPYRSWFTVELLVSGNRVSVKINGQKKLSTSFRGRIINTPSSFWVGDIIHNAANVYVKEIRLGNSKVAKLQDKLATQKRTSAAAAAAAKAKHARDLAAAKKKARQDKDRLAAIHKKQQAAKNKELAAQKALHAAQQRNAQKKLEAANAEKKRKDDEIKARDQALALAKKEAEIHKEQNAANRKKLEEQKKRLEQAQKVAAANAAKSAANAKALKDQQAKLEAAQKAAERNVQAAKQNEANIAKQEAALKQHSAALDQHAKALEDQSSQLNTHANSISETQEIAKQNAKALEEHRDLLDAQKADLSAHADTLSGHSETVAEHERKLREHEELALKNKKLVLDQSNKLKQHSTNVAQNSNSIAENQNAIATNVNKISDNEGKIENAINTMESENTKIQRNIRNVRRNLNVNRKHIANTISEMRVAQKDIQTNNAAIKNTDKLVTQLQDIAKDHTENIEKNTAKLVVVSKDVKELQDDPTLDTVVNNVDNLEDQSNKTQEVLTNQNQVVTKQGEQIKFVNEKINKLNAELEKALERPDGVRPEDLGTDNDHSLIAYLNAKAGEHNDRLDAENVKLQKQIDELKDGAEVLDDKYEDGRKAREEKLNDLDRESDQEAQRKFQDRNEIISNIAENKAKVAERSFTQTKNQLDEVSFEKENLLHLSKLSNNQLNYGKDGILPIVPGTTDIVAESTAEPTLAPTDEPTDEPEEF